MLLVFNIGAKSFKQPNGKESESDSDTDGDGIPDDLESVSDYNEDGDKDGDGIIDSLDDYDDRVSNDTVSIYRNSIGDGSGSIQDDHNDDDGNSSEGFGCS